MTNANLNVDETTIGRAREIMAELAERKLTLATAESCTGGLLASVFTDLEGVSHAFEAGFVVYSDEAKHLLLGIAPTYIDEHGAVSAPVAQAMASQALARSNAAVAVAVTGFAGPGDGREEGCVFIALAAGARPIVKGFEFGPIGRDGVRQRALDGALAMLEAFLDEGG